MRSIFRRLALAGTALFLLSVVGAGPAGAGTCYEVSVDGHTAMVCPWD